MKAIEGKIALFFVLWLLLLNSGATSHAAVLPLDEELLSKETIKDSYPHQFHFEQIEILSIPQAVQDEFSGDKSILGSNETHAALSALAISREFLFLEDLRRFLKIHIFPFHCFW